jgi:predicted house-cleaning noncanonical NTP pyrophosphatase (MazG superfamily)
LADIFEVLEAIVDYKKFSREEIEKIKIDKAEKKGKFKERIILDES